MGSPPTVKSTSTLRRQNKAAVIFVSCRQFCGPLTVCEAEIRLRIAYIWGGTHTTSGQPLFTSILRPEGDFTACVHQPRDKRALSTLRTTTECEHIIAHFGANEGLVPSPNHISLYDYLRGDVYLWLVKMVVMMSVQTEPAHIPDHYLVMMSKQAAGVRAGITVDVRAVKRPALTLKPTVFKHKMNPAHFNTKHSNESHDSVSSNRVKLFILVGKSALLRRLAPGGNEVLKEHCTAQERSQHAADRTVVGRRGRSMGQMNAHVYRDGQLVRFVLMIMVAIACLPTALTAKDTNISARALVAAQVASHGSRANTRAQVRDVRQLANVSAASPYASTTPSIVDITAFIPDHQGEITQGLNVQGGRSGGSRKQRPGVPPRQASDEEKLLDYLFRGSSSGDSYNPAARPVINSADTVNVMILLSLMHIKELDVRSQIFTTTGLLILEWQDERLMWDPENHNGMTEIIVEAVQLWRPEFAVINGAEKIYEQYDQFRAVINYNGTVHWEPGGVFKTMCSIDITYYPFDEQMCEMKFGAWSYHTTKMNLTHMMASVNMDTYNENGEWHILGTGVRREEFAYDCCPNEKFANVAFVVRLRRRHTFYVLNVILPSIMTSVLLLSVFFCTPGQKVQIGVVVLLSFRIFLLNVTDSIPKTSDHIPLLGIYLTCTMAITTLSMVLTVFVLNLHYITDRPVPDWVHRLVLVYLARMMGMCSSADTYPRSHSPRSNSLKFSNPRQSSSFFRRRPSPIMDADLTDEEQATIIEMGNHNHACCHRDVCPGDGYGGQNKNNVSSKEDDASKNEDYAKDWKRLAEIFDRLFFWLFLIAILVSTLILFHPLTLKSYGHTGPLGNV